MNVLRKTLKSVYGSSADLQALNSEIDKLPKNCRIIHRCIFTVSIADLNQVASKFFRSVGDVFWIFPERELDRIVKSTISVMLLGTRRSIRV